MPPVKLVVWAGPPAKEETEEHQTHAHIWADDHGEEGSAGLQKCHHDLLIRQHVVVVCIADAISHQLFPLLVHQVLDGQGQLVA